MTELLAGFLTAFAITLCATPLTISLAKKYKLLDDPKKRPHPAHVHTKIIPRAGGLPVFLGITLSMLFFTGISPVNLGIILALGILLVVGLLDDALIEFNPVVRLLLQFLPAIIAVISGIGIDYITNPVGGILQLNAIRFNLGIFEFNVLADAFAIFWIVWMMNMVNWSKGVDGQMPSITLVAFLTIGFVSLNFLNQGDQNQLLPTLLSFICAGASLGFLIFNWYPAKIFPGFSGSTILGFMISVLAILSGAKLATAGLVLLVPAADFAYTFLRRILSGKSPVWGDRGHLHHKLLESGLTHQQIALFYILGSVILGAVALNLSSNGKVFAAILVALGLLGGILWLNFFGDFLKHRAPNNG